MNIQLAALAASLFFSALGLAATPSLKSGDTAPLFTLKTQEGSDFALNSRKGRGWTVLYFYPKAETPGCTKQACAFRDSIKSIRVLNAEVYGISADSVDAVAAFHKNHHLNFDLLADPDSKVIEAYGVKMPLLKFAKRWTFLIDPELHIREIETDVDPVKDADHVAAELKRLQTER